MGSFKERLREMMEKRGMRQADLVNATGIERSIISSYVTGRYEPKDEKLQLLASALSCDAMWLAGYDGVDEDDDMAFLERFRAVRRLPVVPFSFHDLRHFYASYAHNKGVSDITLQASSGWSSQATMKETYWGEIDEESKAQMAKFNKCVDSEFFGI